MPKITADSVPEHVQRQEAAVIEAAVRLFAERGVTAVGLGDIAKEVGLARNSLYRYFPSTGHILAAWFRETIKPLVERSNTIADLEAPVSERLGWWVTAQYRYLTDPDNAAMLIASNESTNLADDLREEIGAGHRELYRSLHKILFQAFAEQPDRDPDIAMMLIAALARSAAEQARAGADSETALGELLRAAQAVLGTDSTVVVSPTAAS